jgi:hypothetical protein
MNCGNFWMIIMINDQKRGTLLLRNNLRLQHNYNIRTVHPSGSK